jgi:hypothetical protein
MLRVYKYMPFTKLKELRYPSEYDNTEDIKLFFVRYYKTEFCSLYFEAIFCIEKTCA